MKNFLSVERALRTAAPHALLDAVRSALAAHYGAHAVDLLMADYSQAVLQQVTALPHTAAAVPVHSSAQGRAFGSQEPTEERSADGEMVDLHLPVTVRGDRLGVLTVRLPPADRTPVTVRDLADIAEVLGHEILVAERDTDVYL